MIKSWYKILIASVLAGICAPVDAGTTNPSTPAQPAAPAVAPSGPFGLKMGMKASEFERMLPVRNAEGGVRIVRKPPMPHAELGTYALVAAPDAGLCEVIGMSYLIDDTGTGDQSRKQFARFHEAMRKRYGDSRMIDELSSGSRWKKPDEWMRGIYVGHREYKAIWDQGAGTALPQEIRRITLSIQTEDYPTRGVIFIQYEFVNVDACRNELKEIQDQVL